MIVATYFPPGGGISTFRVTKFVKFLPNFNWDPFVVTVDKQHYNEYSFLIDESLNKDLVSDLVIYRSKFGSKPIFLKSIRSALPTRWLSKLFLTIGKIIKIEKPQLLYATGDPFFPLLIAPFAKRFYNLKYVIDLRDPWKLAIPDHPPNGLKSKLFAYLNDILEPIVINNAEKVIVVSEKMADDYRKEYSNKSDNFFIVIPNGYDPDDYDAIESSLNEEFTIVYAGKFLDGNSFRSPLPFLKALNILKDKGLKVNFKYIGLPHKEVFQMVSDQALDSQFESLGYLPYVETVSQMKGANMLLLIGNGQETEQTGKIFDYLGCKKPVLALASEKSGIADVVRDVEHITLMRNEDEFKISKIIENYYLNRNSGFIERTNISQYQRIGLTKKLAEVLDSVIRDNQ